MRRALGSVRAIEVIALGVVVFILVVAISGRSHRPAYQTSPPTPPAPSGARPQESPAVSPTDQPVSFQVVQSRDVSIPGRRRTELRVVLIGSAESMAQVEATLREARWRFSASDAVMVFGYWPGDDTTGPFTAGRYDSGWAPGDSSKFTPGALPAAKPTPENPAGSRPVRVEGATDLPMYPPLWSGFSDGPRGPTVVLNEGISLRAGSKWQGWTVTEVTEHTVTLRSPRGTIRTYDRAGRELKPGAN